MSEFSWNEHVNSAFIAQAKIESQQAEAEKGVRDAALETQRILHGMDLIIGDFMSTAARQGYPGTVRLFHSERKEGLFWNRSVTRPIGTGYHTANLSPSHLNLGRINPSPDLHIHNDPAIWVTTTGKWMYYENAVRNGDWLSQMVCTNQDGEPRLYGEPGGISTDSIHSNLMDTLAEIALKNDISL